MILQCNEKLFDKIAEYLKDEYGLYPAIAEGKGGYMQCGDKDRYFIEFASIHEKLHYEIVEVFELEHATGVVLLISPGKIINIGVPQEHVGINFREVNGEPTLFVAYKNCIYFKQEEENEV
jgi:hypothetical protein